MDKIEGKPFGQPANDIEKQWLLDRLKTLSAREAYQLAAMMLTTGRLREVSGKEGDELLLAVLKLDRKETTEAINCLLSLSDYQVLCPAGGYEKLGEYYLRYEAEMPEAVLPYANLQQIGFRYEELHPGVFIGDCFGNRSRPTMARIWTKCRRRTGACGSVWRLPPCPREPGPACQTMPSQSQMADWARSP